MYSEEQTSMWFREQAELADREIRSGLVGDDAIDSALAHSSVFGYLYDRWFLQTRELLLNELRWLRRNRRPPAPPNSRSAGQFEAARDALLDELMARIQASEQLRDFDGTKS